MLPGQLGVSISRCPPYGLTRANCQRVGLPYLLMAADLSDGEPSWALLEWETTVRERLGPFLRAHGKPGVACDLEFCSPPSTA